MSTYDVLVVGGGIVGLTAAVALAKTTDLSVAVIEAQPGIASWSREHYHHRVSAITLASKQILQTLGVWPRVAAERVSPFKRIDVWNAGHAQQTLSFNSEDISQSRLGYIVENNLLQQTLMTVLQSCGNATIIPEKLTAFHTDKTGVQLTTDKGQTYHAKLAVGADGANSWLRQAANIAVTRHDYEEAAIVATVSIEKSHAEIARQCFLPTGPLGLLPLDDEHLISIVWSQPKAASDALLNISDEAFRDALFTATEGVLGNILSVSTRHQFPLKKQHANAYIAERVVLLGDAAHVIHPLAGQGVNMGLLDVAALVDILQTARETNQDFASKKILRRYERWRKADNELMLFGVDVIKRFFSNQQSWLTTCATLSMSAINTLPLIKNLFTRHAVGKRYYLPTLAK